MEEVEVAVNKTNANNLICLFVSHLPHTHTHTPAIANTLAVSSAEDDFTSNDVMA